MSNFLSMKNNQTVLFDTQIIISNFCIDKGIDNETYQKNIALWKEYSDSKIKFITLSVFSEIIWLIFRRTYKQIEAQGKGMIAKDAFKSKNIRQAVAKEMLYPLAQALELNKIFLLEQGITFTKVIDFLVDFAIDGNDILLHHQSMQSDCVLVTGDEKLNSFLVEFKKQNFKN